MIKKFCVFIFILLEKLSYSVELASKIFQNSKLKKFKLLK